MAIREIKLKTIVTQIYEENEKNSKLYRNSRTTAKEIASRDEPDEKH